MNVSKLLPDQHSLSLAVQVVALLTRASYHHQQTGETIKVAEYLVADPTAQVILKVEDDQINILEEHSQVLLKNARTIAIHGHLRLVVDSHAKYGGQIIPNPEAIPVDKPSNLPNVSDIEFTKI